LRTDEKGPWNEAKYIIPTLTIIIVYLSTYFDLEEPLPPLEDPLLALVPPPPPPGPPTLLLLLLEVALLVLLPPPPLVLALPLLLPGVLSLRVNME
jgi:hypothetical protein